MSCTPSISASVAIVGGGFCGGMLAVQLLRQTCAPTSVLLIERSPKPGRGVAYGTDNPGHLLNVRARNMSAYADDPDHFIEWVQHHVDASAHPDAYLPRHIYGQYVASQLQTAARQHAARFRCIQDEAISLEHRQGVVHVELAGGRCVSAGRVVLALGNFPPSELSIPGIAACKSRLIRNPWSASALAEVEGDDAILLLGSGLTSVDVAIELRSRGFRGKIHVLSRHGLLPQRHRRVSPLPTPKMGDLPTTARGLLRLLRATSDAVTQSGGDWRSVIDSLRPLNQQIWRSLPFPEQRRFLRHLRCYWDVHRHRIAGPVADRLTAEIDAGDIEVHAGQLTNFAEDASGVIVTFRKRHCKNHVRLRVGRVINCTGPESDIRRVNSPFLAGLFANGLARPDRLRLGLGISEHGELIGADGLVSPALFAVGPLCKGALWETIAVPELRVQIAELAERLTAQASAPFEETAAVAVKA